MYDIRFYKDKNGNQPVADYLRELRKKHDKDSRIKLNKIMDYINVLKEHGKQCGEPYIKHLQGEIWELRPQRNRVLFVAWVDKGFNGFVLLHHFVKKTQKTPASEIDKAMREYSEIKENGGIE